MPYDRPAAYRYAETWWEKFHPRYPAFENDCTNFVSQVLLAGRLPMVVTGQRDRGWWYLGKADKWSFSWTVAHSLRWFLDGSGRAKVLPDQKGLLTGDVIFYDWNGDGGIDHVAVVSGQDSAGQPLVAGHTRACWNRPWAMTDSSRYSARTRNYFVHILD